MKSLFDHIEYLKGKPHHVRRKVAVGAATIGSGIIGLVWLVSGLASGSFAVGNSSFADFSGQQNTVATTSVQQNTGLAAAAAAVQDNKTPAHIEIVDTSSSAPQAHTEQTTIPF